MNKPKSNRDEVDEQEFAELIDKDIEEKLSNSIKEQNPDLYLIHRIIKDRLKEMVGEE